MAITILLICRMAKARFLPVFYCLLLLLLSGCSQEPPKEKSGYFSVNEFVLDQCRMLRGQPNLIHRIIMLNGNTSVDSDDIMNIDWSPVFAIVAASDISAGKFNDQYRFSNFEDPTLGAQSNVYEAKDDKLFTRRLLFTTDPETNRIGSVYIETADETAARKRRQKLYYAPHQLLHIEEQEEPKLGKARNLRIEYQFTY